MRLRVLERLRVLGKHRVLMWHRLLAAGMLAASGAASAETIAIVGGKVVVGDGSAPMEHATVLIRDGRIAAVGNDVAIPVEALRVDASGQWVTAGVVAALSQIGLAELTNVPEINDTVAKSSVFSASLDVVPAINPFSEPIAVTRSSGVTRAFVKPDAGHSIFAGLGAVISLRADQQVLMRGRAFEYVEFGEAGAALAGGSRTATFALFRDALRMTQRTPHEGSFFGGGNSKNSLVNRSDAAALAEVVNGSIPLFVHVGRASDILAVLSLRKEFPALNLVLVGVEEGWMVAEQIAAAKIPVLADPLIDVPDRFEQLAATESNIGRMLKAGVRVAVAAATEDTALQNRLLRQYAGNLVALNRVPGATGVTWEKAFELISAAPAQALGLGTEFGSLRPGCRADVVLWNGDPLELSSAAVDMFIDGIRQPLGNRQTQLRDRYLNVTRGGLPKAYAH